MGGLLGRAVLAFLVVLSARGTLLNGGASSSASEEEGELRESVQALQDAIQDVEYNSDEYVELKSTLTSEQVKLKNYKWMRVGMSKEDYKSLCALDLELSELRNMGPSVIIELPQVDRKERLKEMRSLKKQMHALMDPFRADMKALSESEKPNNPPPPAFGEEQLGKRRIVGHRGERLGEDGYDVEHPLPGRAGSSGSRGSDGDSGSLADRERKRLGGASSSFRGAGDDDAAYPMDDAEPYKSEHLHPDPEYIMGGRNKRFPDDHHGKHHQVLPHQMEGKLAFVSPRPHILHGTLCFPSVRSSRCCSPLMHGG